MSIAADLIDRARNTPIEGVAEQRGLKLKRSGAERVGSCPNCGGVDRFALNVRKQIFLCRQCGAKGGVIDLEIFLSGCDFRQAVENLGGGAWQPSRSPGHITPPSQSSAAQRAPVADDDGDRIAAALGIWNAASDPRGTPVESYLASRWLELGDDVAGETIRWHGGVGAMIALFRDIVTDEPRAVSRTFLDKDARKIERKFLGPVGGAAVKLDRDDAVIGGLHVAEGVESALAARQLKMRPCWALGSKGAIGAFPVLAGIETLTILAEPDAAKETETCAARWFEAGREVFLLDAIDGKDANDVLMRRRAS
jgi:hypothetical protein